MNKNDYYGILSDIQIRMLAKEGMITPFEEKQNGEEKISFGLSSYGYDARISEEFKIFSNINNIIIDPKEFDKNSVISKNTNVCIIPPNSCALGRTIEYFSIPKDVFAICVGKSTYARCGIIVNVTPLEPGWQGHVVIELSNSTSLPVKIYANEGICQFLFFRCNPCEVSYNDRAGKYMGQTGITFAKVLKK